MSCEAFTTFLLHRLSPRHPKSSLPSSPLVPLSLSLFSHLGRLFQSLMSDLPFCSEWKLLLSKDSADFFVPCE